MPDVRCGHSSNRGSSALHEGGQARAELRGRRRVHREPGRMKPFGQRLHEDSPTRLAYLCAAVPVRCPPGTYTSSPASISRTSWHSSIAGVLTVLAGGTDLSPQGSGTTGVPSAFYCDHLRLGFPATVHGVSAAVRPSPFLAASLVHRRTDGLEERPGSDRSPQGIRHNRRPQGLLLRPSTSGVYGNRSWRFGYREVAAVRPGRSLAVVQVHRRTESLEEKPPAVGSCRVVPARFSAVTRLALHRAVAPVRTTRANPAPPHLTRHAADSLRSPLIPAVRLCHSSSRRCS